MTRFRTTNRTTRSTAPHRLRRRRRRSKQTVWPAAALVGAVLAVMAGMLVWRPWQPDPVPGCVFAVDTQGGAAIMADSYGRWLPGLLRDCALDSRADIAVLPVSSDTVTTTTDAATLQPSRLELTGDRPTDDVIVAAAIDDFAAGAEIDAVFDAAPQGPGGTDLLAITKMARPYLTGPGSQLTILSDALHNQEPYQLRTIPLDDADISNYLQQLRDRDQLPDLSGVEVRMFGVNVGGTTASLSPARLAAIERWWRAYWSATGAVLTAYQRQP